MKRRFGRRKQDRWTLGIAIAATLGLFFTYTQVCNTNDGPSAPTPTREQPAPVTHTPANPSPQTITPTPPASNPGPMRADINNSCGGTLTNTATGAPHTVFVRYTVPGDNSRTYLDPEDQYIVDPGKTAQVPTAQEVFEQDYQWNDEECSFKKDVQCDFTAGQGEHLAGKVTSISLENPRCGECEEDDYTTIYGEWGECDLEVRANNETNGYCFECRSVTVLDCDENVVKRGSEQRQVECPGCQNDPSSTPLSVQRDGNPLTASTTVSDSGDWRLRISASDELGPCEANTPDHWKNTDPETLECGEEHTLNVSYNWLTHSDEWWRIVLYRNGSVFDQTACFRNPHNDD